MTDFVERPARTSKYDYEAIIATATNGKSVEIPVALSRYNSILSTIAVGVARRGYRLRTNYDRARQVLFVWCEKLP